MMQRERDESVDFARGIGMLAVTYAHVFPCLYGSVDSVCKIMFSFELAVFFIVSGYIQEDREERTLVEYIRHTARTLLYPYVTFSLLIFFSRICLNILKDGATSCWSELPLQFVKALTWGEGATWFLLTFFFSGILFHLCRRTSRVSESVWIAVSGGLSVCLCAIAEKYGVLREVTSVSTATPAFWLWHILSFLARGVVGLSLILIGAELKKHAPKKHGGGGSSCSPAPDHRRCCCAS